MEADFAYEGPRSRPLNSGMPQDTRIMQPASAASALPVPKVNIDEPVSVVPVASVAPLDGAPDGERINIFAVKPKSRASTSIAGGFRERVLDRPLTYAIAAFSLGFVAARLLR